MDLGGYVDSAEGPRQIKMKLESGYSCIRKGSRKVKNRTNWGKAIEIEMGRGQEGLEIKQVGNG